MPAFFGAPDLELWSSPLPELLREVAGLPPSPMRTTYASTEHLGTRSVQRLALAGVGGQVIVALWPAEPRLKRNIFMAPGGHTPCSPPHAHARGRSDPRPALAFFNSHPSQRLYMTSDVSPEEYASRWESLDAEMIGRFPNERMPTICAWLVERGYLLPSDAGALQRFEGALGGARST